MYTVINYYLQLPTVLYSLSKCHDHLLVSISLYRGVARGECLRGKADIELRSEEPSRRPRSMPSGIILNF